MLDIDHVAQAEPVRYPSAVMPVMAALPSDYERERCWALIGQMERYCRGYVTRCYLLVSARVNALSWSGWQLLRTLEGGTM